MMTPLQPLLMACLLLACLSTAVQGRGVGDKCNSRRKKCDSGLSCQRTPVVQRCVTKSWTYPAGSRGLGKYCYDSSDCQNGLACYGKHHHKKCDYTKKPNVNDKVHGDVFRCNCDIDDVIGATYLDDLAGQSLLTDGVKYMARFDVGSAFRPNHQDCYCAIVEDLYGPWFPSGGGRGGKGYETWCLGYCGAQCGVNAQGLTGNDNRYAALVTHDVCQSFIGSTESSAPFQGGLKNACGDEAIHGKSAQGDAQRNHNQCDDGANPTDYGWVVGPKDGCFTKENGSVVQECCGGQCDTLTILHWEERE